MRESKCYISVACFHYGGSDLLRFGKFEVLITSQALLSQKQPIFMQNYNFVKNDVFVAKICKYALYESSEGLFCAPRKAANFCHPVPHHEPYLFGSCQDGISFSRFQNSFFLKTTFKDSIHISYQVSFHASNLFGSISITSPCEATV